MTAHNEFQAALAEYWAAHQQFDQADPGHIDIAIHRLRAAELRVAAAIRALKEAQHHVAS